LRALNASSITASTLPSNRHGDELTDELAVVRVVQVHRAVEAGRRDQLLLRMVGDRVNRAGDTGEGRDQLAVAHLVHADLALAVARRAGHTAAAVGAEANGEDAAGHQ